jgi:hypothetical protein
MRRPIAFCAILLALLAGPARAQGSAPASAAAAPSQFSDSHLAAARDLLDAMHFEHAAVTAGMATFDQQAAAAPDAAVFRDLVEEWMREIFTGEAALAAFARAYAETLSETELRELAAFYRTPLGQRLASVQPTLTAKGMAVGQQLAGAHQSALEERIMERAAALEGASPAE